MPSRNFIVETPDADSLRGTWETALGFPEWPYGKKRVVVCTHRAAVATHGEEIWSGDLRDLAAKLEREGVSGSARANGAEAAPDGLHAAVADGFPFALEQLQRELARAGRRREFRGDEAI